MGLEKGARQMPGLNSRFLTGLGARFGMTRVPRIDRILYDFAQAMSARRKERLRRMTIQ
jgi:hypothetical protein